LIAVGGIGGTTIMARDHVIGQLHVGLGNVEHDRALLPVTHRPRCRQAGPRLLEVLLNRHVALTRMRNAPRSRIFRECMDFA
jgi:hypothetical protein